MYERWGALTGTAREEVMRAERMTTAAGKKRIFCSGLEDDRRGCGMSEGAVPARHLQVFIHSADAAP